MGPCEAHTRTRRRPISRGVVYALSATHITDHTQQRASRVVIYVYLIATAIPLDIILYKLHAPREPLLWTAKHMHVYHVRPGLRVQACWAPATRPRP